MSENTNVERELTAAEELSALNKITMKLLEEKAKEAKRLWVALIVSILVNAFLVTAFLYYESQFTTTVETVTTTVTQDTGEGQGNNVYQAGESATYNE